MSPRPLLGPGGRARSVLSLLGVTALLAVLAGCTAGGGATGDAESSGPPEKAAIKVGVIKVVDVAPLQRAQAAGYFADEGLTVELVEATSGEAAIPELTAGGLDIAFSNWTSLLLAQSSGDGDFRFVNAGYDAAPNTLTMVTRPDSDITAPAQLSGKKIAVNSPDNITELAARSALLTTGVDPRSITIVEVPYPEMVAALQDGRADAAVLVEPFITQAETQLGAVSVLDVASGPTAEIPIAGYAATAQFLQANPNTVAAFQRAMDRAQLEMTDRALVEEILPTYSDIRDDSVALLNLGNWPPAIDASRLQRVADLMREFGMINQPIDVAALIQPSA